VPIGITVEGANIVTRALIQFGQGAIRSHPYLLKEMTALQDKDRARGLEQFDRAFWGHVGHTFATAFRAWARAWTGGLVSPAPDAGASSRFYKSLGRYAAGFALAADVAMLTLGGALKRKEMVSARFGDILSELYLLSAALKRWQDEGRQDADLPLLEWCMESGFATIESRFDEILLKPSATRDRLTVEIFHGTGDDPIVRLERAFGLRVATEPLRDRLRQARVRDIAKARQQGLINDAELGELTAAAEAIAAAVEVDDFAPEELSPRRPLGDVLSQVMPQPTAAE
jgi:acyl-CoA dehydrogenase